MRQHDATALRLAGWYAAVGCFWILFTDAVAERLATDVRTYAYIQTYKGWFYVLITAVLVFVLGRRALAQQAGLLARVRAEEHSLRESEARFRTLAGELEQRVGERTAALEALNEELSSFSYSVSHDLKAPLRTIDGFTRILEEDFEKDLAPEARDIVARIRAGVMHMQRLIADLLAYAKMETTGSLESVSLAEVVAVVLEMDRDELESVQVRVKLPDIRVRADREGLTIVLRNLVQNAIKFSRASDPPTLEISAEDTGEHVRLCVRDNGIGFDMQYHDRIFQVFQRLERSEDYPGTGVGLAMVRKSVQRMGGRVWAESEPGNGATFFVELPRTAAG